MNKDLLRGKEENEMSSFIISNYLVTICQNKLGVIMQRKKGWSAVGHLPWCASLQLQIAADARKDLIRCNNSAFTESGTEAA